MCDGLAHRMAEAGLRGTVLSLKLKDTNFDVRHRTGPPGPLICTSDELCALARARNPTF